MKKTILGCVFILFATFAMAQDFNMPYGFRLGLTAHPTIGWLKPQAGKSDGVSLGFSYGLLADFNFAQNYSFSTGFTVTTINGKSTEIREIETPGSEASVQTPYDLKYMLQYIEVPLAIKLRTAKIDNVRWYGQFGLTAALNIGAEQDADIAGESVYRDQDIDDSIRFYRTGLLIGAGGEFDLGPQTSVTAGLSFNNGFTDITSDDNDKVRNHYVGINFGVLF